MTTAEALNILANLDFYAMHGMHKPQFNDMGDGKVSVSFRPVNGTRAFGLFRFESARDLDMYISGRIALTQEQEADAQEAAQTASAPVALHAVSPAPTETAE